MQPLENFFMQQAIQSAKEGIEASHGGPFGACIVKEGKVIAIAHNTVLKEGDPTCHAEMNAIRLASKALKTHILKGCELYTTAEPCPMCMAAIYWASLDKVFVGLNKERVAEFGFQDEFLYRELNQKFEKRMIPFFGGIMSLDCEAVFEQWQSLGGQLY